MPSEAAQSAEAHLTVSADTDSDSAVSDFTEDRPPVQQHEHTSDVQLVAGVSAIVGAAVAQPTEATAPQHDDTATNHSALQTDDRQTAVTTSAATTAPATAVFTPTIAITADADAHADSDSDSDTEILRPDSARLAALGRVSPLSALTDIGTEMMLSDGETTQSPRAHDESSPPLPPMPLSPPLAAAADFSVDSSVDVGGEAVFVQSVEGSAS